MGLTANSLPEAWLGDVGAGKFQLLFSSVFSCAVCVSLEFSVIFLLSKYTDCPNCRYSLRRDCKRDLKKIGSRSMEMLAVFFKTSANTTPRQSFLLEGLNRFSLDKYPSFWEKLPNFVLNKHWQTRQFSEAIPLHFSSREKLPCWLKRYFRGFYFTGNQYDWVSCKMSGLSSRLFLSFPAPPPLPLIFCHLCPRALARLQLAWKETEKTAMYCPERPV